MHSECILSTGKITTVRADVGATNNDYGVHPEQSQHHGRGPKATKDFWEQRCWKTARVVFAMSFEANEFGELFNFLISRTVLKKSKFISEKNYTR